MNRRLLVVAAFVVSGCTSGLTDVKPGVPRGFKEDGFGKTTEGLSMTVLGRPLADVWAVAQRAALRIAAGR